MKKYLIIFLFLGVLLSQISFAYDPVKTHAGLTEQTIEFYNLNSDTKISDDDKDHIIQGSMDEDDPAVRALNHFYDPTRNMGINNYRTALVWALEPNNGNEFSWPVSIQKYAEGDTVGAMIGLGHILHLIQDMTVPDHTRNDPHIGDGPVGLYTGDSLYEDWARDNKDRGTLAGIARQFNNLNYSIYRLDSLADYFNYLAIYSNHNYVSVDTIENSNYQYVNPVVIEKRDGYAYGDDSYFYDRHKLYIEEYSDRYGIRKMLVDQENENFSVLEEYFSRLAKVAILSGAGVVEIFFTEARQARGSYLEAERIKQEKISAYEAEKNDKLNNGGLLSKIWYRVSYAVTDTSKILARAVTNTTHTIGSSLYNGSSYALNLVKNNTKVMTYTGTELATVGAKKVQKAVVSTSQKVILYVKTTASNLANSATPAVAYNSPTPTVTPDQLAQLIAILKASSDTDINTDNIDNVAEIVEASKKKVRKGGGNSNISIPTELFIEDTSTTTSTTTDDIVDDVITNTSTTTTISEIVSAPTILLVENITNTTPTTTILFSGTSTPNFLISEDLTFTSTTTDSEGNWSLILVNVNIGTTTLNFFAEPDSLQASSTSYDPSTGVTIITNYLKSEATEAMVFVGVEDSLNIEVTDPIACADSLLNDRCLITTTSLEMSWTSSSSQLDHYVIILNEEVDEALIITDTSVTLELENQYENIIEIFAVDTEGNESDHTIYEVIVYTLPIVINEVAWMGTRADHNDEWLELYNRTPYDIDLSAWLLKSDDDSPNIDLEGIIEAEGFYLLERTDDTTISDIDADQIYTGALNNEGEVLTLYFGEQVIDQTPTGDWTNGDNNTKGTMERRDAWFSGTDILNWLTNLDYFCNGLDALGGSIRGTPRMPNVSTYPPALM